MPDVLTRGINPVLIAAALALAAYALFGASTTAVGVTQALVLHQVGAADLGCRVGGIGPDTEADVEVAVAVDDVIAAAAFEAAGKSGKRKRHQAADVPSAAPRTPPFG